MGAQEKTNQTPSLNYHWKRCIWAKRRGKIIIDIVDIDKVIIEG